jgi:Periplasmic binding protein
MIRWLVGAIGLGVVATHALAADPVEIGIGYLRQTGVQSKLSLVEQPAGNDGLAGALLAIEDNNTTGKFLNQHFTLEELRIGEGDDVAKAATALAGRNGFVIADLPAEALLKAADALRDRGTVLLNAGSIDDRLREEDCRPNVIHVAPTRSMLADALAQYLVWKQWKRWILVAGSHEADKLYAAALRRAAVRFGAKIVQERTFEDTGGARRTDSGVTLIQRQMPVFTQQMPAFHRRFRCDSGQIVVIGQIEQRLFHVGSKPVRIFRHIGNETEKRHQHKIVCHIDAKLLAGAHLNSSLLYLRAAHVRLRMTNGSDRNRTEITDHGKSTMGCTGQPLG